MCVFRRALMSFYHAILMSPILLQIVKNTTFAPQSPVKVRWLNHQSFGSWSGAGFSNRIVSKRSTLFCGINRKVLCSSLLSYYLFPGFVCAPFNNHHPTYLYPQFLLVPQSCPYHHLPYLFHLRSTAATHRQLDLRTEFHWFPSLPDYPFERAYPRLCQFLYALWPVALLEGHEEVDASGLARRYRHSH